MPQGLVAFRSFARGWRRSARVAHHVLVAAAACCASAPAARAQGAKLARVDGVATDSVHGTVLSGALVLLTRRTSDTTVSRSAATDADGRFAFTELPAGTYLIALESALLDSLELSLPTDSVTLAPGDRKHLQLSIPSGGTLRTLVCPDVILPPGIGALAGRVQDASDERPLHGVLVSIGWNELTVDRTTLRAANMRRGVEVRTDSFGRFLVCGVPTESYLDVGAAVDSYRQQLFQLVIPESVGVARRNFSLNPEELAELAAAREGSSASAPAAAGDGPATLSGVVYGSTAPLSRVQVQRRGDAHVVSTDSLGRYRFASVPIGTQLLELRRVGYLPQQVAVDVRPGQNVAPDLHLTPGSTLDSIRILGQRTRYREFESRAKVAAFGHFLRAEEIERRNPLLTSDLIRQMPGFRIVRRGTSDLDVEVVDSRGLTSLTNPDPCVVKILIDGVPNQGINWIAPWSIGAMEIYPGTATGPVQYQSACGTILIWTKR
jgi:hypothetical protein